MVWESFHEKDLDRNPGMAVTEVVMNQNEGTEPKELESDKMLAQINAAKAWKTPSASDVNEPVNSKPEEPEPTQPEKASKPTVEQEAARKGKPSQQRPLTIKSRVRPRWTSENGPKRKGFKEGDQISIKGLPGNGKEAKSG